MSGIPQRLIRKCRRCGKEIKRVGVKKSDGWYHKSCWSKEVR